MEDLPDNLELAVVPVTDLDGATRQAIEALCTRAFKEDAWALFSLVPETAMHVLARLDGSLVGHACWTPRWLQPQGLRPLRSAYLDAVAVEPALHGRGIGSAVVRRVMDEIRDYEIGGLSTGRVAFYQRLGWELWRGPTAVRYAEGQLSTIDETVMILRTPQTPPLDPRRLLSVEWRAGSVW